MGPFWIFFGFQKKRKNVSAQFSNLRRDFQKNRPENRFFTERIAQTKKHRRATQDLLDREKLNLFECPTTTTRTTNNNKNPLFCFTTAFWKEKAPKNGRQFFSFVNSISGLPELRGERER